MPGQTSCSLSQILPNLPGKRGNRVKDLQKKLAERDDSRQSTVGKQDPSAIASKQTVKVGYLHLLKLLVGVSGRRKPVL